LKEYFAVECGIRPCVQDIRQADYPQRCLFCVPSRCSNRLLGQNRQNTGAGSGHPTCTDHVCSGSDGGVGNRQAPGGVDTRIAITWSCKFAQTSSGRGGYPRMIAGRSRIELRENPRMWVSVRHDLPTDALTAECQITAQHSIFGALPPHARLPVTMDNGTQDVPPPRTCHSVGHGHVLR